MEDVKFNIRDIALKPEEFMSDAERERAQFEKNKMEFRHSPYNSSESDFTGDSISTVNLKQRFASISSEPINFDANKDITKGISDDFSK